MKKVIMIILALATILSLVATGAFQQVCGQVDCLQNGSTLWGVQQVLAQKANTIVLESDTMYMLGWPVKGTGQGFIFLSKTADPLWSFLESTGGKGNVIDAKYFNEFVEFCKKSGWKVVPASTLPSVISTSLNTIVTMYGTYAKLYPTLFAMPLTLTDPMQFIQPMVDS